MEELQARGLLVWFIPAGANLTRLVPALMCARHGLEGRRKAAVRIGIPGLHPLFAYGI
jgi:hypothetical protein